MGQEERFVDNTHGKKKFIILISVFLALQLADGLLTYINTPDLAREGNPLVAYWGFGWLALFIANLIAFVMLFFLTYYSFVKYKTVVAPVKNKREYISQLFYKRPDKFIWSLYKIPKRWTPFLAIAGYSFIYSLILARAILVVDWLAVTFNYRIPIYSDIEYKLAVLSINSPIVQARPDVIAGTALCIYLIFRWIVVEYKKSCAEMERRNGSEMLAKE